MAAMDAKVAAAKPGANMSYVIELGCSSTDTYRDACGGISLSPQWAGPADLDGLFTPPSLYVTIKGANGCTGDRRPVLSSNDDEDEGWLIKIKYAQYFLTLQDIVLDGAEARPCISANPAGSLTLVNVDVINGRNSDETGTGDAPGLTAISTPTKITGGKVGRF